ncbi:MAG: DUF1036 domain-containing protein [Pseudomonadota bacterium]
MRTLFLGVLGAMLCSTAASAKYSLCNKSSYTLNAAIGFVDGDRLATRGWWRLRPGQCKVALTEQTNPGRYFVYAEAIPGHQGSLRTWSGDTALCVESSGFFSLRNQDVCRDNPLNQRQFFDVEVTEAADGDWQTDFAEARTYTIYSAEVAGVQRLLNDIGLDAGRIDGAVGRATQRVIQNYRKKKGLAEADGIDDELIDALIEDANQQEAKLGFFYCNKTDATVWSAISTPDGENYDTKGWWKLDPGGCAKILKGELTQNHYYVYGVIEDDAGERRLAGGEKAFCINFVKFESSDTSACSDQELDEAVFRRIEIGASPSATFEFLPDMFVSPPVQ